MIVQPFHWKEGDHTLLVERWKIRQGSMLTKSVQKDSSIRYPQEQWKRNFHNSNHFETHLGVIPTSYPVWNTFVEGPCL